MATRTITVDQLPGGNFIGGGSDTLFLSGKWPEIFDLTQASFTGFTKIVTDDSFTIKMTNAQFSSISEFEGTPNNNIQVNGSVIDLRGKQFKNIWGISTQENATFYADSINVIYRVNAYRNIGDTLKYFGSLSREEREAIHDEGFDIVVDQSGEITSNLAPTLQGLNGDEEFVRSGKSVFVDVGGNAFISDDRSPIAGMSFVFTRKDQETYDLEDYIRVVPDNRFYFGNVDTFGVEIIFDGVIIGKYYKDGRYDGSLNFSFNKNATNEIVNHLLHRVEYVRGKYSKDDKIIKVAVTDKGGLKTSATVLMRGEEGSPKVTYGSDGKDVLVGIAGKDKIYGGYGNDKLTGGAGADTFVFSSKLGTSKTDRKVNFDTITDFSVKDDTIWLDNKYFVKLGKSGSEHKPTKLKSDYFKVGSKAMDKNDYLIYNKKTGVLSYDPDGPGRKAAIEIAKFSKNPKLTISDFFVV